MAVENLLSAGAITQILEGYKPANPVLQIIGYKPMTPDQMAFGTVSDELRYRLMIGDGIKAHQYCVITNQDIVEDIKFGRLEKWSIIRVTKYQTADYGEGASDSKRRLVYILNLEVVKRGSEVGRKITCDPSSVNQQPQSTNPPQQVMQPNNMNQAYNNNHQQAFQPPPPQNRIAHNNFETNNSFNTTTQPQPYPGMQPDLIRSPRSNRDNQTIGIGELTPYIGKWIVKGRVTSKSAIREYNNARGGGKLFNFTFADKTGEIKVTAFNADCERVFAYVEPNKVYFLGRASVKSADKRYSQADFEITLNNDSLLEEVVDSREINDIPLAKFNFVSIASLENVAPNLPVDIIGAIEKVGEFSTIISRTKNKELKKRNVTIVDMSRCSISVTIWGDQAETFTGIEGDIFVTKAARVGTYGGRSASAGDCIFINPDIPEVRKVKSWYDKLLDRNFKPLTTSQDSGSADQWKTLEQMLNIELAKTNLSTGQQSAQYAKCKSMLMSVGKNPVYKCCPTEMCGKKLVDTQNGELKCEKCQQTFSDYKYRYKTDIEIGDPTTSAWVTLWDEKAENIFGMKPEELARFMKMENKDQYERIITKPNFKPFIFTLRSRIDTYNQEERVKLHVVNMAPLDVISFSKRLMEEVKMMGGKSVEGESF